MAKLNDIQQAMAVGLLANHVLEEYGLDHEDRLLMWQLILSDSEAGKKAFDQIWTPALEEAGKRLAQQSEGTPPGPERH